MNRIKERRAKDERMLKHQIIKLFRFRGGISLVFYMAIFALLWQLIIPRTSIYYKNQWFQSLWSGLNQEDILLVPGESIVLRAKGINHRLTFVSTDIKVADVNLNGKVTANRVGLTFIKVYLKDTELKCRVRVIDLSDRSVYLQVGKSTNIRLKGIWFGVHWESEDVTIATVNRFGKIVGKSKGKTTIIGKVKEKSLECFVVVD